MNKKKIKILFLIRENKINVYEYRNKEFESIQEAGEEEIEYTDKFMNWFRGAIAYSRYTDQLDYLIITDNSVELNFEKYDVVNESFWKKSIIEEFNKSILSGQGLILRNVKNREYYRFNVKRNPLEYTVLFCDKNVNRSFESKTDVKKSKGVSLPKKDHFNENLAKNKEQTIVKPNVDLNKKDENLQREEVAVSLETQNKKINTEKPNLTLYYKDRLKQEEAERNKNKY